jgi:hypothetical protein
VLQASRLLCCRWLLPLAALGVVRERWGLREEREEKTEEGDFAFFSSRAKLELPVSFVLELWPQNRKRSDDYAVLETILT